MNKTSMLSVCCLVLLTGCSAVVKREVTTEVLIPPSSLTVKVKPELPPNVNDYVNMNYIDKEEVLVNKYREQTKKLEICNSQLQSIDNWGIETLNLYKKKE